MNLLLEKWWMCLIRRDVFLNRFDGRCLKSPNSAFPPVFYDRMLQSKVSKISHASKIIVLIPFKCIKWAFTFMTACWTIWYNLIAKNMSFLGIGAFKNMIHDSRSMIHSRMNFRFYHWLNVINRKYIIQPHLEL